MTSLYTLPIQLRWTTLSLVIFVLGCASDPVTRPVLAPMTQPDDVLIPIEPEPAPTVANVVVRPLAVRVRPDYPVSYTVRKGDTLWDIAARFLKDPWVWPAIWDVNPQIENPHLIYPGDVISLEYIDGKPRLLVNGEAGRDDASDASRDGDGSQIAIDLGQTSTGKPIVKLSPRIRILRLDQAIPAISADAIEQFTVKPRVLTREKLDSAPYVIGNFDNRLVSAVGDKLYVRGILDDGLALYSIFHPGKALIDPRSEEILGYEAVYVGDAKVLEYGDPTIMQIIKSKRETLTADVLLPLDRSVIGADYVPHVSELSFDGTIISLFDALGNAAQNQVVVINLGKRDGIERGDILGIEEFGGSIRDDIREGLTELVDLPDTRIGIAMVFRVFDRVSYGLIMESTRVVQVGDIITNP